MKILKSILLCTVVMAMITSCQPTKKTAVEEATEAVEEAVQEVEQEMEENIEVKMNDKMLVNKTWKLTGITFYQKDQILLPGDKDKGLTIKFMEDGKISYKLSVNSCFGTYSIKAETMRVKLGGCTKMCCDSEFADKFQSTLGTAKAYKISDGKYLQIDGEDKILKFELVK
jgi:heat shock protein HslJ